MSADAYYLRDDRWGGMFSIWGQKDNWTGGVCYGSLNYEPKAYIKEIGEGCAPVEKAFIRWCDEDLANYWLGYLLDNIVPDEVKQHIEIERVHQKGINWPQFNNRSGEAPDMPWEGAAGLDEKDWREARKGKYHGCLPWLRIKLDQKLSVNDMFTFAVLLRYASEHAAVCRMTRELPKMYPWLPTRTIILLASFLGRAGSHAIGGYGSLPVDQPKVILDFDMREKWKVMHEKSKPFFQQPKKEGSVDHYFPLGGKKDPYERKEYAYASWDSVHILSSNGLSYKVPCDEKIEKVLINLQKALKQ